MIRRGMNIDCVYFHAYPYTSEEAKKKAEDLAAVLAQYGITIQSVEILCITESAGSLPLLRPLFGMDNEELIQTALEIGTYDISILPYEDCCVLFAPKHPVLHGNVIQAQELYANLDCESFIQKAVDEREIKIFKAV